MFLINPNPISKVGEVEEWEAEEDQGGVRGRGGRLDNLMQTRDEITISYQRTFLWLLLRLHLLL